jgi:hypothetical protein
VIDLLRDATTPSDVLVSALADETSVTLRAWAENENEARRLESDLRLRSHARLREAGIYA